jgi:hypothetical protein
MKSYKDRIVEAYSELLEGKVDLLKELDKEKIPYTVKDGVVEFASEEAAYTALALLGKDNISPTKTKDKQWSIKYKA